MWRPMMFLLCLIAALTGSPLRQAEAAGDLARTLAELDGGDVIEAVDGGVGDDAGETVQTSTDHPSDRPAIDDGPDPIRLPAIPLPPVGDGPPTPGPTADPVRRYAWLQDFRF